MSLNKTGKNNNMVQPERVTTRKAGNIQTGPIIYWMSRDQRANHNWALLHAMDIAKNLRSEVVVVFCLVPGFLNANWRQYDFMLKGLEEVERDLQEKNISFYLLTGEPGQEIPEFIGQKHASALVTDFDPLKIKRQWKEEVENKISIPFHEVDAHNIVPCRHVSNKKEFGAYTLRPKIRKHLDAFLIPFPGFEKAKTLGGKPKNDWAKIRDGLRVDKSLAPVDWIKPGSTAGEKALEHFVQEKLALYDQKRNDPNEEMVSGLSPYLHFGQLSSQHVALRVYAAGVKNEAKEAFLEELIVRKELSDNFCWYEPSYGQFKAFPGWAKKTLDEHRGDEREYLYTLEQFEQARTHDSLWNAAQVEMVRLGKMHGYMRMYWAKKILEWTKSPEEALDIAIYLNDKYELDGRDPNGYTGCAWAIGGVHDRAWKERPVYGKIRYMNANGASRKFNTKKYIQKFSG